MLRVRLDGGELEKSKFKELINLAKKKNLKLITTARAGLELHYIYPDDILEVYNIVKQIGFTTHQSLTDNVRAIILDPLDGLTNNSFIDSYPILEDIKNTLLDNPKYFGMIPRKFNCAIVTTTNPQINFWGNDLLFALAKGDNGYGFNVYMGGKNSEVAKSANIFIYPNDLKRLFFAIVDTFLEYGLRESRSKTRLYHLILELGIKDIRAKIEQKFGSKLLNEQKLLMQNSDFKEYIKLKDNTYAKAINCNYGEIDLDRVLSIINSAKKVRVGANQRLYLIGIKEKSNFEDDSLIVACAGARYCPLSLWDIKKDINELNLERFAKEKINIGFSGCLKGCGRHHHNHIGLVGLRSNMFGKTQKALRVFIGSCELPNPTPARLLYYAVPLNAIDRLFEVIINEYKTKNYKDFNEFNLHLNQFSTELLQLWFILRQLTLLDDTLIELFHTKNSQKQLLAKIQELKIYPKKDELFDNINILSHQLWDN